MCASAKKYLARRHLGVCDARLGTQCAVCQNVIKHQRETVMTQKIKLYHKFIVIGVKFDCFGIICLCAL